MFDLDDVFSYHAPQGDDLERYSNLRSAAKQSAQAIVGNAPPCADRTAAIRKVREAVMTANAAVALQAASKTSAAWAICRTQAISRHALNSEAHIMR